MDYYTNPNTLTWVILGLFLGLVILSAVRSYITYRKTGVLTYNWLTIINFAETAVDAVNQTHQTRPPGITDAQWNDLRLKEALHLVTSFATSLGVVVSQEQIDAIIAAIEAAVLRKKQAQTSGLVSLRSAPASELL